MIKSIKLKRVLTFAAALYIAAFMVIAGSHAAITNVSTLDAHWRPVSSVGTNLANDGVLDAVLEVFTAVGTWIGETIPTFYTLFYSADGLTFLGVMAVASLSFAVIFLCIGIIQKFLAFRA